MENFRNEIQQHFLTARKLILDARYYRYHRAWWEEDKADACIFLAKENLKQAEMLLQQRETFNENQRGQEV